MIRLDGVSKSFGDKTILDGLDLHVERGEVFAIMGRSGTGKSVMLKHMVGLMKPDSGSVWIDGVNLGTMDKRALKNVRRRFGFGGSSYLWKSTFN